MTEDEALEYLLLVDDVAWRRVKSAVTLKRMGKGAEGDDG